jgi:hypothetical protein
VLEAILHYDEQPHNDINPIRFDPRI